MWVEAPRRPQAAGTTAGGSNGILEGLGMSVDETIGSGSAAEVPRAERLPALVARARAGDQTAWAELLDSQFRGTVEDVCGRRVSDRDVLDEAWEKAIDQAKSN